MTIHGRLLLIFGIVCLTVAAVPLTIYMVQRGKAVHAVRQKRVGIVPLKMLVRVLQLHQQHRGLSAGVLAGRSRLDAQRAAKQAEIDRAVEAFDAMMSSDIRDAAMVAIWRRVVERWKELKHDVSARSISGRDSFAAHTALIGEDLKLLDLLVDHFGMLYDPTTQDYHLIVVLLVYMPNLTELLGQARARGILLLADTPVTLADRTGLIGLIAGAQRLHWSIEREFRKAMADEPLRKAEFGDFAQNSLAFTQRAIDLARTGIVEVEAPRYPAGKYYAVFTAAIDGQFALLDAAMVRLEEALQSRLSALRRGQNWLIGWMAVVIAVTVWLGTVIVRRIRQDIAALEQNAEFREMVRRLGTLFSRSLRLQEVYPDFARAAKAVLPYDRISVVVPEGTLLVTALCVAEPPLQNYERYVWRRRGDTAAEWVMTNKAPRLVRDLTSEQTFADEAIIARGGVHSMLMTPLIVKDESIGVLVADSRAPDTYDDRHVELLSLIAEQFALALQNALLHAEVVRYTQELEGLVEARTRELQIANDELQEVSRHKTVFLANMSHELRTPLNAILGFADLLRDGTGGPLTAKQARYTDHIHTSGTHLLALINDLLDLSKVEAGKLTLRPEPFILSEALAVAAREIQPMAEGKRLILTLDVDQAPIPVTADPIRFKQIVYNLLSNAIKFTPEGGRITVTARRASIPNPQSPGDFVEIAVTDTGIGIAAEDLPRLFARFSQLEAETTKRFQGSGLGLAVTKQLVELHGGTMGVTSAGPGQGSTFTICLPLAPDAGGRMEQEWRHRPLS